MISQHTEIYLTKNEMNMKNNEVNINYVLTQATSAFTINIQRIIL